MYRERTSKRKNDASVIAFSIPMLAFISICMGSCVQQIRQEPQAITDCGTEGAVQSIDCVYAQADGIELHLDLYLPEKTGSGRPAVVFMHGGGWRRGSRSQFKPQATWLAERGYVCASIQYRLSDQAAYPAAVKDCKTAVRWMQENAEQYGVDPKCIAVAGGSAGGHLAALAAVTYGYGHETAGTILDEGPPLRAAVIFNGVFDFREPIREDGDSENLVLFLGGSRKQNPERYAEASPIVHVQRDRPPFLLLHGTGDTRVPFQQSVDFQKAILDAGARAELIPAEGQGHGWFNRTPYLEETFAQMETFLNRELKGR